MKRLSCLILLFVSITCIAWSQINNNKLGLGFSASVGLLSGAAEEIVYMSDATDDKLSQLLWYFEPLFYAGVDLEYHYPVYQNIALFAEAAFKYMFPAAAGIMEDRDWTVYSNPHWLTHFSESENKTESSFIIGGSIGASFTYLGKIQLRTFISYSYMSWAWTAKGGSMLYSMVQLDNENFLGLNTYLPASIHAAVYRQKWNIISLGASFYGELNPYFGITVSFKLSPLVWLSATDEHLLRKMVIQSDVLGGFQIEPGLALSFRPDASTYWTLLCSYKNISGARGDGVYTGDGVYEELKVPTITASNMIGSGYSAFSLGFRVTVFF